MHNFGASTDQHDPYVTQLSQRGIYMIAGLSIRTSVGEQRKEKERAKKKVQNVFVFGY